MFDSAVLDAMRFTPEREVAREALGRLWTKYPDAEVQVEYPMLAHYSQLGTGDIRLITDDVVVVLETKFIDVSCTGKTASVRRTKHRSKVRKQCVIYCAWSVLHYPEKRVVGYVATNEDYRPNRVIDGMTRDEAKCIVIDLLQNTMQNHVWGGLINQLKEAD